MKCHIEGIIIKILQQLWPKYVQVENALRNRRMFSRATHVAAMVVENENKGGDTLSYKARGDVGKAANGKVNLVAEQLSASAFDVRDSCPGAT
jgi:hypothetical protein